MPSSDRRVALGLAFVLASSLAGRARAQQQAQGFAVERFYPSAPGGGWLVMDDLDMRGALGGVVALQGGYALDPLRVTDGVHHLAVVSDQALGGRGLGGTYGGRGFYLDPGGAA